ncbi:MAG: hypothetical protein K1X66_03450 [Verrucomicrobiae bacterium]|nr:hypothetical protein [Verrucomicrobiae bacterium]
MGFRSKLGKAVLEVLGLAKKVPHPHLVHIIPNTADGLKTSLTHVHGLRNRLHHLEVQISTPSSKILPHRTLQASGIADDIGTLAKTNLENATAFHKTAMLTERILDSYVRAANLFRPILRHNYLNSARKVTDQTHQAVEAAKKLQELSDRLSKMISRSTQNDLAFGHLIKELEKEIIVSEKALNDAQDALKELAQSMGIPISVLVSGNMIVPYHDNSITTNDLIEAGLETLDVLTTGPIEHRLLGTPKTEKLDRVFGEIEKKATDPNLLNQGTWGIGF